MHEHLSNVEDCLNYGIDVINAIYTLLVNGDCNNDKAATLAKVAEDYMSRARDELAAAQVAKA